jgi:hypothetical protein
MPLTRIATTALLVATLGLSACNSTTSPTTFTPNPVNDVLTGTVQPPVDGVFQTAFNTFIVGQGGGSVTVTLTSAVETFPGGTLLTSVSLGIGVGPLTNGVCTVASSSVVIAQASSAAVLSGTLPVGTYCVQLYDVTNQSGPVAYAVAVSHP